MARKTASRIAKRKEAEAAEAAGTTKKKKKAAKKKTTKKKATKKKKATRSRAKKDVVVRRKMMWVVYSSTMKEEARFAYHDKKDAEAKLEALRAKSKKTYFMQQIKEPLTDEELAAEAEAEEEAAE